MSGVVWNLIFKGTILEMKLTNCFLSIRMIQNNIKTTKQMHSDGNVLVEKYWVKL